MLHLLRVLLRKEFTQLRRDPVILRLLFVMPMIQLIILANAATFEVKRSRLWIDDRDRSTSAQTVVDAFMASGRFVPSGHGPVVRANEAMLSNEVDAILSIPPAFGVDLQRTRRATLQLVLNAVDGAQAGVTQGYANLIVQQASTTILATLPGGSAPLSIAIDAAPRPAHPAITISSRNWFNPSLVYHWFTVPGILTQLVTLVGTLMTALNIVREKEAGTLEQLNVTPITRGAFILSKLIPLWCIALVQLSLGLLVAHFIFGVPIVGHVPLIFLGAGIYLIAALGVGLWVSTLADTQQQALFITFAVIMVYTLMSGLYTPVRGMPDWVQWVAQLNPVLHFIALMRAVTLKGAGLMDVVPQLLSLAALGGTICTMAVLQYHKRAA
jgi:ABC-2 type transport system permease protein